MLMCRQCWGTPNPPTSRFGIFFCIFLVANVKTSNMVHRLIVASPRLWTINHPWMGHGYITWPVLNFWSSIHISGMAEARAVKLCTGRLYQVLPNGWNITPKRRVVELTWPIFACATVDLEKFRHSTPLNEINNVSDSGSVLFTSTTIHTSDAMH